MARKHALKKPGKAVERCVCFEWNPERVPVHIRYARSSTIYLREEER